MSKLITIPVNSILVANTKLREVDTESTKVKELIESVKEYGVMSPISVRKVTIEGQDQYQLVDGLHRLYAARMAGLEDIDVKIVEADDQTVLFMQIVANAQVVETKPAAYSAQLITIMQNNPTLTQGQLAQKLGKSPQWLNDILKLKTIENESIRQLIDEGQISVISAVALSRLPPDEQVRFVDAAMSMPASDFVALASKRKKDLDEAKRAAREPVEHTFSPIARLRTIPVLKEALDNLELANAMVSGITDAVTAFQMGLKYAISMTPADIESAKQKFEQQEAAKKQAAEDRKIRRQEALSKKAAEAAAEIAEAA